MADIWDKIGVKPYEADPSKARLPLGEQKPKSQQSSPSKSPLDGTVFAGDGTLSNALRSMGETGLNYMNTAVAGANLIPGVDIDNSLLMRSIAEIHTKQDQSDARTLSPMRKAETDKIKNELAKADGIVDNVIAGGKMGWDVMRHPIENAGQIIGGIADPMNFIPGVAGAKVAAKLGGGVLARATSGAVAGAVSNAPVNAIEEGTFAAARGEDWRKSAASGFGAGIVGGALLGGVGGAVSRPRFASDNILSKFDQHIGTHEVNHASIMDNALMQTPDGEKFDPNTDIGFTRETPSVTDHPADTLPNVDHHALYGQVMGEHLDSARSEGEAVYSQALAMAQDPKVKPEHIKAFVDNAITPTHDDLSISDLVNDGDPLPSRFSGMRLVDVLERNIKNAIENPTDAKTNIDLSNALKKEGMSKELNNVFTKAYSAKDPTILTNYIMEKTQPLADDIRSQVDEHLSNYKAQSELQKAQAWANNVPESAQDLVSHPKFAEHLNERADVSASDARYAQVRTADLALSHANNGQGYETVVQQPAQFDRNYNYDFEMTKKDVADIKVGRWNDELVQKLRNDLERRDNDPLYNPETPSIRLHREMSAAVGADQASMNMALIDGRAKAMGITPDELIDQSGLSVENMRDIDGAQYVNDLTDISFQKDPVNREKRGIYNVQFNGKNSTKIMKDMMDVEQALRFEQGFENPVLNKGYGALHIDKHIGPDKDGWVSKEELLNIGEAVRNVEPYLKDGKRVYEYHNDAGDRFRLIVGDRDSGENVISFYSNRKAGKGNNTLTYVYPSHSENKSLHQKIPDVKLTDDQINGMAELGIAEGDMKSIIYLFKTADASTLPHELMHVFERTLSDVERSAVDDVLKDYAPGTPRKEALARYFEKYLADGEAPTPELKGVFDKFRDWLTSLWENIAHDGSRDFKLTDVHRELYRALLGDREAAAKLSERYDGIVNEQIRAEADRAFQNGSSPERLFQRIIKDSEQSDEKSYIATKNILEKMIDTIGEKIEQGADMLPDGIRPWLHPTKAQKMFAEYQSALREESAQIWEQAREIKSYLESSALGENGSRDLVRALGGDMAPEKLSDDLKPIYTQMRKVIDANAQALIDAGALDEKHSIDDYLKRYYEKHEKELGFFKKSLSMGKKFARKDLSHDERLALGMIEDASLVIPNTLAEQRIQLMQARVLKQIAEDFALDEPHEGYARISDESVSHNGSVKKYGALAGKFVPIELKEAMTDMGNGVRDLTNMGKAAQAYMAFIQNIKTTVTVKNPMTHAVNVGSNMTMAYLNGHLGALARTMSSIGSPHFKELVRLARENGMTTQLDMLEARDAVKIQSSSSNAIISKLTNVVKNIYMTQDSKLGKTIREAYDWEDRIFKLAAFDDQIIKMKNQLGRDLNEAEIKQAFREANDMYIDYNKPMPHVLQMLDNYGLMPFVGYTYRSIPQVAKTIARNPFRFMLMQAALAGMGMSTLFNENDDMAKPSWAKDGFNFFGIKNWVYVGNSGWALNSGRLVPGLRFTDLTFEGGFVKSLANIASGTDPLWGSALSKEDDPRYVKIFNIAKKYAESFTPSMTPTGRYGQRMMNPGKNPSSGDDRTRAEVIAQALAARKFDPKSELQKNVNHEFKKMEKKALISEETDNGKHVKKYADVKTVSEAKAEYRDNIKEIDKQARDKSVVLKHSTLKSTAEKHKSSVVRLPRLSLGGN